MGFVERLRSINISALLPSSGTVRLIGRAYRRHFPEDVGSKILERRVLADLPAPQKVDEEVKRRLARLIREDFAAERVFLFRSWILSRTEGQLCALL